MDDPTELTILGSSVRHPVDHVECFPAPDGCIEVSFRTEELSSVCPVTGQPDLATAEIVYVPRDLCVESKSLKLYLWSFRDRQVFAEALAVEIATEIERAAAPHHVKVTIVQRARGGISLTAVAELPRNGRAGRDGRGAASATSL